MINIHVSDTLSDLTEAHLKENPILQIHMHETFQYKHADFG